MLLYPRVFRKAQEEMDRVTGGPGSANFRLPTFGDRPRLPYMNAIVDEVLRWAPIAPMGLPHVNMEDVEYEGYRIPKGSIAMPNIWRVFSSFSSSIAVLTELNAHFLPSVGTIYRKMAHDENVYEKPFEFYPERFLRSSASSRDPDSPIVERNESGIKPEQDVRDYIFGFGRRICPGKELADATLFMVAAMSIAVFDLRVPEHGRTPGFEFQPGTLS